MPGAPLPWGRQSPFPVLLGWAVCCGAAARIIPRSQSVCPWLCLQLPSRGAGRSSWGPPALAPCQLQEGRTEEGQGPLEDAPGRAGCCSHIGAWGSSPALSFLGLGGPTVPLPGWGSWDKSSKRAGGLSGWFRHWSPFGLGQGPGLSVPEFPGGEQEGAEPCRDCPEQGGSTGGQSRCWEHPHLPPASPRSPPAAQAAPGVLCWFQSSLGNVLLLEIFTPVFPWTPLCCGAVPPVCSSGCQGPGDMAGWQMGADSVPELLLQCCWKEHLELT